MRFLKGLMRLFILITIGDMVVLAVEKQRRLNRKIELAFESDKKKYKYSHNKLGGNGVSW